MPHDAGGVFCEKLVKLWCGGNYGAQWPIIAPPGKSRLPKKSHGAKFGAPVCSQMATVRLFRGRGRPGQRG